jgi:hypothetical protein
MANTDGKIEIGIGADITDLHKGISDAERELKKLQKQKAIDLKADLDVTALNSKIATTKAKLQELQKATQSTGSSFTAMAPKVANGGNALSQFSRIAQDAPYGIIGIGNNITATAEAFGHLKNQTGSTGGALKAMASSLMGTGGILLGVSLLTTGFTLLAQSGLSVGDIIDKITGNFDEAKESLHKLGLEAAKTAGTEISELKSLVSVAQNDTKSREERLIAVQKLQSEFPAYFGNLSTERILNGNVTESIKNVSDALKARARASAIYGKVGELSAKRLELEEKREQSITKLKEAQKASDADSSVYAAGLRFNLKGAVDDYKDIVEEIKNVDKAITKLQSKANVDTTASVLLEQKAPPKIQPTKQPKAPKINPNAGNEFTPFLNPFESSVIPPIALTFTDPTEGFIAFNAKVLAGMTTNELMWQDFGLRLSDTIESGTENALIGFGESLGNALTNGTNIVQSIGQSLVSSLGQMISSVGKELVKMGVLAQAYAAVVKWMQKAFTNPYALAAAGVALIVIGSAISGSASKVGSGGGSTSTSSGSSANISSRVSGGFTGGGGGFGGGTVVFEIAGTSLIGVLNNTQARNLRIGGTN